MEDSLSSLSPTQNSSMNYSNFINLALLAIEENRNHLTYIYEMEEFFNLAPSLAAKYYRRAEILYSCGQRGSYELQGYGSIG